MFSARQKTVVRGCDVNGSTSRREGALLCFKKIQKLDISRYVVSLMDDCVLLSRTSPRPGRPNPNKQSAKQGHSLVPQLPCGNGEALSH